MKTKTTVKTETRPTDGMATVADAAKFLNTSERTIHRMVVNGEIKSKKVGRLRRIPWAVLHAFAK